MNTLRQSFANTVQSALATKQVAQVQIGEEAEGQRIDNFLMRLAKGVPKSHIYRILRSGEVRVNKGRVDATYRLQAGDLVRIPPLRIGGAAVSTGPSIPDANFPVLYEDAHLLIVDKPAGVAVHGGSGVSFGVIEQLRKSRADASFLELVHRLDRETSGILLLAKKRSALVGLHAQIRDGQIDKRYLAGVKGVWQGRRHLKFPLHKYLTPDGERRVRVDGEAGQTAHTVVTGLSNAAGYSLVECELKTGRTHQIRVHLAHADFPILGDDKYGDYALNKSLARAGARPGLRRMFLHAHRIVFRHPASGETLTIQAELPPDCKDFLNQLERLEGSDDTKTI